MGHILHFFCPKILRKFCSLRSGASGGSLRRFCAPMKNHKAGTLKAAPAPSGGFSFWQNPKDKEKGAPQRSLLEIISLHPQKF
jgi:hypothetical protein